VREPLQLAAGSGLAGSSQSSALPNNLPPNTLPKMGRVVRISSRQIRLSPFKNALKIHLAIQPRYVVSSNSFAAVRPRMSALSSSLSEAEAKMWSTGWSCHG
jgi:hypothetical protein